MQRLSESSAGLWEKRFLHPIFFPKKYLFIPQKLFCIGLLIAPATCYVDRKEKLKLDKPLLVLVENLGNAKVGNWVNNNKLKKFCNPNAGFELLRSYQELQQLKSKGTKGVGCRNKSNI